MKLNFPSPLWNIRYLFRPDHLFLLFIAAAFVSATQVIQVAATDADSDLDLNNAIQFEITGR